MTVAAAKAAAECPDGKEYRLSEKAKGLKSSELFAKKGRALPETVLSIWTVAPAHKKAASDLYPIFLSFSLSKIVPAAYEIKGNATAKRGLPKLFTKAKKRSARRE